MANQTLEMLHGVLYGSGVKIGKLSKLGRVTAAMVGKHGDRVPFMGPQIHDHVMTVSKVPARKFYWDPELFFNVHVAVNRWYDFDAETILPDVYNFEVEALGAKLIYSDIAMPTVDTNTPLIKSSADLDKIGRLDVTAKRIPFLLELASLQANKIGGSLFGGFFCAPFSFLCQAMGYPKAVRALLRDKAFAEELFDYTENEVLFPLLKAQRETGVKSSTGADAWTAFPNLSIDMLKEWVVPSTKRLQDRCKKELGMTITIVSGDYCEEDPAKFDKDLMFQCFDVLGEGSQPMAFAGMGRTQDWDIRWLQEYAVTRGNGRKLPIYGGLNGRFSRDSSPEEIADKVREWIDIAGRDGKLLLWIANVPADTPPVNVHTAVKATKIYGQYPIADDLNSIKFEVPEFQPFDEWLVGQPEEETILKARERKPEKVYA